eukprot:5134397-Amphidinium_carterae.1
MQSEPNRGVVVNLLESLACDVSYMSLPMRAEQECASIIPCGNGRVVHRGHWPCLANNFQAQGSRGHVKKPTCKDKHLASAICCHSTLCLKTSSSHLLYSLLSPRG